MTEGSEQFAARLAADQDLLGLTTIGPAAARFTLTARLARPDGRLYGGTALAASIAATEMVTGRQSLWNTVQFVSSEVGVGHEIEITVDVPAAGRRTSQVQVAASTDGRLIFSALGANVIPKAEAISGTFADMPDVPSPDECEPFGMALPSGASLNLGERNLEVRIARRVRGERTTLLWGRVPGRPATAAVQGYLGDWVATAIVNAAGRVGAGTSLDNTLRTLGPVDLGTEWVLLENRAHGAADGYGMGEVLIWSPGGTLLSVASQTSSIFAFD